MDASTGSSSSAILSIVESWWFFGAGIFFIILGIINIFLAIFVYKEKTTLASDILTAGIGVLIFGVLSVGGWKIIARVLSFITPQNDSLGPDSRGKFVTVFIVLLATIGIFFMLFKNYAGGEAVSFSTGALISLAVLFGFGILYRYSSRIEIANVISRFLMILYYFAPYAFFMFGILTDIFTRNLQFSPASFAGLTGILFNFALSKVYYPDSKPFTPFCEIPGLAFLSSNIVPQSMMSVLSTIAYIATYISRSSLSIDSSLNSSFSYAVDESYRWPAWVLYFSVWGIQTMILSANNCLSTSDGSLDARRIIYSLLVPLGYGGILGLIGSETIGKQTATASGSPPESSPVLGATKSTTTPTVGTCSAGSSDGEFVCESFENGKLKRSVITE